MKGANGSQPVHRYKPEYSNEASCKYMMHARIQAYERPCSQIPPAPIDATWFATHPRGNKSMLELVSGCRVNTEIKYVFNLEDEDRTKNFYVFI